MDNWEKLENRKLMELEHKEEIIKTRLKALQDEIFVRKVQFEDLKEKRNNLYKEQGQ
jgi:hypothetical protein|tara:strand:+ start:824 stop:994 length:171 start_codon:yes stop_codon:yes gene_type:complete